MTRTGRRTCPAEIRRPAQSGRPRRSAAGRRRGPPPRAISARRSAGSRSTSAEAEVAPEAEQRIVVREQPVDPVGRRRQRRDVEAAPARVAVEHVRRADVLAAAGAADHHLGQRRHVAQAEVQPLPGQRMDAVRRVADQRQPRAGAALRQREPERIAVARARRARSRRGSRRTAAAAPRDTPPRRAPRSPRPAAPSRSRRSTSGSPGSGRMASGPDGMKNWCAIPRCGSACATAADQRGLPVVPAAPPDARPAAPPGCRGRRRRRAARRASVVPSASVTSTPARRRPPGRPPRLDGRCATSGAPSIAASERRRAGSGPRGCGPSALRRSPGRRSAGRTAPRPRPARPSLILISLDRLRPGGEPAPRARAPPASAASRAPAHRRGRRSPASAAPPRLRASSTMLESPPCGQRQRQHRAVQPAADDQDIAIVRHARGVSPGARRLSSRAPPG